MTYHLKVLHSDGSVSKEAPLVAGRPLALLRTPGVEAVSLYLGDEFIITVRPPLPPHQGPLTRLQVYDLGFNGFTRD